MDPTPPATFRIILAGLIVIGAGQTVLQSIFGPLSRALGLQPVNVGAIISSSALVLTFASPYWGKLIDKFGERRVFISGMLAYAIGTAAFSAALRQGIDGNLTQIAIFPLLLCIRIVYAATTAGVHPAASAYVARSYQGADRTKNLALVIGCFEIGTVIGPSLLVISPRIMGPTAPLDIAAFLALLTASAAALYFRPVPRTGVAGDSVGVLLPQHVTRGTDVSILSSIALANLAFSSVQQCAVFSAQDRLSLTSEAAVKVGGEVFFTQAVFMVSMQAVIVRVLKITGIRMVAFGICLSALALPLISLPTSNIALLIVPYVMFGMGFSLAFPGLQSILTTNTKASGQGSAAGKAFGAAALGYIGGPVLGTGAYQVNMNLPLVVSGVACMAVILLVGKSYVVHICSRFVRVHSND